MTKSAPQLTLASLRLVASILSARRVAGQETPIPPSPNAPPSSRVDSLPFRRGQWGAEFGIDDGTLGLGVLRFRSTRTAWQLNTTFGAAWIQTDSPFGDQSGTSVSVSLRAGPRKYSPIGPAVAAYVGTGLMGAYNWSESDDSRRQSWDAGVFGEVGGAYFVTPRLSLGARVDAWARYTAFRQAASSFPVSSAIARSASVSPRFG